MQSTGTALLIAGGLTAAATSPALRPLAYRVVSKSPTAMASYGLVRSRLHKYVLPTRPWEANLVVPGLILGGIWDAHNPSALKDNGVSHIVSVVSGVVPSYPDEFGYLHVSARDIPEEKLQPHLEETTRFLHTAISDGGCVYVHCMQGKSRSATVVLAYLMSHCGMSLDRALSHAKARRPIVEPNEGFMAELRSLEVAILEKRQ